jgi:hypothetical protein
LVKKALLEATYLRIQNHDLLLKVVDFAQPPATSTMVYGHGSTQMKLQYNRRVCAQAVWGLTRMVLLNSDEARIQTVPTPTPNFCDDCKRITVLDARDSNCVIPLADGALPGIYHLLYGCTRADTDDTADTGTCCELDDSHDTQDDENYSYTPLAQMYLLLNDAFQKERTLAANPDGWCDGGAMPRLSRAMGAFAFAARHLADDLLMAQLRRGSKISYVYDFVSCPAKIDCLRFVIDARRSPLRTTASSREFFAEYGLERKLRFQVATPRKVLAHDLWSDIY